LGEQKNSTAKWINDNSVQFLFICMLTQQPKGQVQSEHEWKEERNKRVQSTKDGIYKDAICVIMHNVKVVITTFIYSSAWQRRETEYKEALEKKHISSEEANNRKQR
jgi:hypothetical protein